MQTPSPSDVLSVGQLNRLAKQLLEDCFAHVTVSGEISNLARPGSGHWYFTLKDDRAQIRCAMFKGRNFAVRFQPQAGQQVQVTGKVSLYEGRGDYQLIVDTMQPAGAGALAQAFEQLKQELKAAGRFDRKRPLPKRIRHLAVITSPTGAAIRDVLSVIERRWPALRVTLIPTQVQGDQAASQLVTALQQANRLSGEDRPDVILLTRGGGSLEDLWPFNERIVADAVFASELPVVSAVGHEVDFSISDFVADLRAPTPSAAAELLCPDQQEVVNAIRSLNNALHNQMQQSLRQQRERQQALHKRLRNPSQLLAERSQRVDERELYLQRLISQHLQTNKQQLKGLELRLLSLNPARQLQQQQTRLIESRKRLLGATKAQFRQQQQRLNHMTDVIRKLSPDGTLQRGYAIVLDEKGKAVRDAAQLKAGERITARLASGRAVSVVERVEKD
ncbi:exodeoxyribonuclease VII large subunit [Litorivivens lipolytica]|uniref:Exodeoxyribonuclease 7 large subunit n=1 Tax=Litorivivens lipolytica TaxID=1524264 RepID=A0A7W4Z5F2_9GAMM|nr:exodeoxyribonuclease VII large subunit [Litorivivens lipolytica]MBB3045871.1 exodeoxyribonuclease VII large subunit [Litorivivens lipolytica]